MESGVSKAGIYQCNKGYLEKISSGWSISGIPGTISLHDSTLSKPWRINHGKRTRRNVLPNNKTQNPPQTSACVPEQLLDSAVEMFGGLMLLNWTCSAARNARQKCSIYGRLNWHKASCQDSWRLRVIRNWQMQQDNRLCHLHVQENLTSKLKQTFGQVRGWSAEKFKEQFLFYFTYHPWDE